jgi:hypothetical protein
MKLTTDFSAEAMEAKEKWMTYSAFWKKQKAVNPQPYFKQNNLLEWKTKYRFPDA